MYPTGPHASENPTAAIEECNDPATSAIMRLQRVDGGRPERGRK